MGKYILHIANDYSNSHVYKELVAALSQQGIAQLVYTAVRSADLLEKNKLKDVDIQYAHLLSPYTRVNFFEKARRVFSDVEKRYKPADIRIVHAHTWYSDGAIAYRLHRKYGIPYIVTIRNTDLHIFYRYMLHLRSLGRRILLSASKIIFISQAHKAQCLRLFRKDKTILPRIEAALVIPNGINQYWLENCNTHREKSVGTPAQLCYIGRFLKLKNIPRLIKAIELLSSRGIMVHLTLIGGGGRDTKRVQRAVDAMPELFTLRGWEKDKTTLATLYRESDIFVMPSLRETFGLVYVEALSQGCPIVYSQGEGVDGTVPPSAGEACNPRDIESIARAIERVVVGYESYGISQEILQLYHWENIAKRYATTVYGNITG